ncbi:MAG: multiheme c-type cytochrome [Polyangiaceae bacterium]
MDPVISTAALIALQAMVPRPGATLAPSLMETTSAPRGADIAEVDTCAQCHADVVSQWRTSSHAFASFNNPIYRSVIDSFRTEVSPQKSKFCGGCHDLALMVDGAMDGAVEPSDSRAHAGITCRTCHSITHTRPDGNGSFTLDGSPIPIPPKGDVAATEAHVARVASAELRGFGLCAGCHRAFLDKSTGNAHHLIGQDDVTPWQRSAYAGSELHLLDEELPEQDCRGCHMPQEATILGDVAATNGKVASHRFLGAHTWLAAIRGDQGTLARTAAFLKGVASVDVAAVSRPDGTRALPADGAAIVPGERMTFDVVVRNRQAGHRFPGGVMDAQDAWIEVTVRDANGALLAEAGGEQATTGEDPTAHRLRSFMADENGMQVQERQTNRFRAGVFNATLAPREAVVVQIAFDVPADLDEGAQPLQVTARLRHRTRSLPLQRVACADSQSPRGRAFRSRMARSELDACIPQPITDIDEASVWLGAGAEAEPRTHALPDWQRLYEHGLGWIRAVQEKADEARPSLLRALDLVEATGTDREQAMVLAALGMLAAREGRVDEAVAWAARAEQLMPNHPAIAYLRGLAHAEVWRWQEATRWYDEARPAAGYDDRFFLDLALARGSTGDDAGALSAAWLGLAIQPRDADLLRIQALSLRALGAPVAETARAEDAYAAVFPADMIPRVRAKCSAKVPGCANERSPVHVHEMRPAKTR